MPGSARGATLLSANPRTALKGAALAAGVDFVDGIASGVAKTPEGSASGNGPEVGFSLRCGNRCTVVTRAATALNVVPAALWLGRASLRFSCTMQVAYARSRRRTFTPCASTARRRWWCPPGVAVPAGDVGVAGDPRCCGSGIHPGTWVTLGRRDNHVCGIVSQADPHLKIATCHAFGRAVVISAACLPSFQWRRTRGPGCPHDPGCRADQHHVRRAHEGGSNFKWTTNNQEDGGRWLW